jgi:hypothetical protein
VYLPLVMADSGHQVSSGVVAYYDVYRGFLDAELARPAQADVSAHAWRVGNRYRVSARLVNRSGTTLSAANGATVHAIVYEEVKVGVTSRTVRDAVYANLGAVLADGADATVNLETADIAPADWSRVRVLVLADYRPGGASGPYDMLQAAFADIGGGALPSFTDDPLIARTTPVKASHVAELRLRIDELRLRYWLSPFPWTDATLAPGTTTVKASHLTELRTALDAVYTAAARAAPGYTRATVVEGSTVIGAVDIAELRAGVTAIW